MDKSHITFDRLKNMRPKESNGKYSIVRFAYDDDGHNAMALLDLKNKKLISYSLSGQDEIEQYRKLSTNMNKLNEKHQKAFDKMEKLLEAQERKKLLERKLSPKQKAFRKFFFDLMDTFEITSPAKLKNDEDKKEFWNTVSSGWKKARKEQFNESTSKISMKEAFKRDVKMCLEAYSKKKALNEAKDPEDIIKQIVLALTSIGLKFSNKLQSGSNDNVWFLSFKIMPISVERLGKVLSKFYSVSSITFEANQGKYIFAINIK